MTEKIKESERGDIISHSEASDVLLSEYPDWLKERLSWFQDLKFGLFIHWGIYSQWECLESWPLSEEDTWARPDGLKCWENTGRDINEFRKQYWDLNKTFNPLDFDPESWAETAKFAGMKYVNFTSKHHDGFCMWDTETTDYKISGPDCPFHSNPKADVVKEVFDAFRDKDFAVSCYFSKCDWKSPYYWDPERKAPDRNPNYDTEEEPERWRKFVDFTHRQIKELLSNYGIVDMLWLDAGQVRPPLQDLNMAEIARFGRELQPGLIVADRTVGGEYENIITPEQRIPDSPINHPWESCITLSDGWGYCKGEKYKTSQEIIAFLIDIVAKGGNLLLNVGPTPQGTFTKEVCRILKEIGEWMTINGEAIYGTRPVAPYTFGIFSFTQKDKYAYALTIKSINNVVSWKGLAPVSGSKIFLLGSDLELDFIQDGDLTQIELPLNLPLVNKLGSVFKFQIG